MPGGTIPPDPWVDPKGYIVYLYDEVKAAASEDEADTVADVLAEAADIVERLRSELPGE